ncbi:copper amine oxidase N-terminal domain-containing protein [Paenibacillus sp. PsM32]|uniref:Copper amine oxidase N-terminal domain-containing protein n=1 Tax=Paenibacillus kyungheensis TaxID=1452732 RepID=A0AAX3LZS9_9BACL|nr:MULTISPECIES: copper amine oxidase N-terminal domain-containing protein [Paenibacillus]MDN4620269.1 copper amine oxidase N-terminal domain-containing protein [Paenibacillus sp. PsM32]WCT55472.1 copper amine oxidase N-terminal domain-containing protein [Paenibacillus kyungheensis]
MKKKMMTVLAATILFTGVGVTVPQVDAATNKPQIEVLLDARKMAFPDAKPFQDDSNAVMVPIRFVSEKLGAKVGWSKAGGKQIVTLKTDKHTVSMTVGSATAVVDGESKTYDSKIILKQSRTFVPLRLVSEGLGQTVNWDQISKWVWIGSKKPLTIEELGLPKTTIDPYKPFFSSNPKLMTNTFNKPYKYAVKIKSNDFPLLMAGYIYGVDLYTFNDNSAYSGFTYIRVRTYGNVSPNLYLLTNKGDVRYRYKRNELTQKNSDGTIYNYYGVYAKGDEVAENIKDKKQLSIQDIKYIGFDGSAKEEDVSLVLMDNPWRR